MTKFVGGPLDGQEIGSERASLPARLYVRSTGKGFSQWAYMFLVPNDGPAPQQEFRACAEDFDPTKLYVYDLVDGQYVYSVGGSAGQPAGS